jgi:hypothetical protein
VWCRLFASRRGLDAESAPADAPVPAMPAADAPVTFGSFNLSGKVGVDALRPWRGALDAVPGSRLLLKARSLGDPAARESTWRSTPRRMPAPPPRARRCG